MAPDVTIDSNVILSGKIKIGKNSVIGANSVLHNVQVGENVTIESHCVIENAIIGSHDTIGPFAHIRPGTHLKDHVKVGNFVEIKNSHIQAGSKIPHLSYIGDSDIGEQVNIGAGVITVNYDGAKKSRTLIENNAFIGCDSQLIAPLTVGENAYIAAGSTITQNAPADSLTLCRARDQITLKRWQRPKKEK